MTFFLNCNTNLPLCSLLASLVANAMCVQVAGLVIFTTYCQHFLLLSLLLTGVEICIFQPSSLSANRHDFSAKSFNHGFYRGEVLSLTSIIVALSQRLSKILRFGEHRIIRKKLSGGMHGVQVDLYENGTIAIAEAVSPELGNRVQRVRVQLPGTSQELLNKFREKKVDFAAHSNTEDGAAVFLNLLGKTPRKNFSRAHVLVSATGLLVGDSSVLCFQSLKVHVILRGKPK